MVSIDLKSVLIPLFQAYQDCSFNVHKISFSILGVLLPLWKFEFEKDKRRQVTAVAWNAQRKDLFAVAYGSFEFSRQGPGVLTCFSLKNPTYPEYIYRTESGILCADFHLTVHC